ncbi:MAG: hypothetical protein NTV86_10525, partial [Planctomycetota bacterium]|nr:hypothetical protein [Planctomycetota bacterium]
MTTNRKHTIGVSPASTGGLSSVPGWLAGLLATGGEPAACRRFFRESPGVSTETVRLCAAGAFARRALGRGRPDYVFYKQPAAGGPYGLIELKRAEGAVQGYYSTRWPAGADRAALARGRFLNSEDFFLAGTGGEAVLFVGVSGEATRACQGLIARSADRGELGGGRRLYTTDDLHALLGGASGPNLFVVEALPARPAPGGG